MRHWSMKHTGLCGGSKDNFCSPVLPDKTDEECPFFWSGDIDCSRGISTASKGGQSQAPKSEEFQLPLGKTAFVCGNYNLSFFGEHGFPQPSTSYHSAFPGR